MAIEKKIVYPFAFVLQPLSGALLIFEAGYSDDFFSHEWLLVAIVLYVAAFYIAVFVQTPALESMIGMAREGRFETPEFAASAKRTSTFGPALTLLLLAIIVMMVLRPGT